MSSTIEFNRQFIRSEAGITPVWLVGDNRTTTGSGRHERFARNWSLFQNILGATEEEILKREEPYMGGYQQHWLKRNKWVDDEGLRRWIRSGCKNAATIEEILHINHAIRYVRCCLRIWGSHATSSREELMVYATTTKAFDDWISAVRERMDEVKATDSKAALFPCVDFGIEDLAHPSIHKDSMPDKVLFKNGTFYLTESPSADESRWATDIQKAFVFDLADAERFKETIRGDRLFARAKLVSAAVKDLPRNSVIEVLDGPNKGYFVRKATAHRVQMTPNISAAKHYTTSQAKSSARAMNNKYQSSFGVVSDGKT